MNPSKYLAKYLCNISTYNSSRNDASITPESFPISQMQLTILQSEVKAIGQLRLVRSDLHGLLKSSVLENRKNALNLSSNADVNAVLDETEKIANMIFHELGGHIPKFRYELRLEYFRHLIGAGAEFNVEKFNLLKNHTGFPGHNQLQIEVVRKQIENDIEVCFGLSACRDVQRFTRKNISNVTQAEYAQHCLNLYNLAMPISREATQRMISFANKTGMNPKWKNYFEHALKKQVQVHVLLSDLLRSDFGTWQTHNTHPASRLLEYCTGFVLHPKQHNVGQLINPQSPIALHNIGKLITNIYLQAHHKKQASRFLNEAFVRQHPCFEATIENLLEFDLSHEDDQFKVPKKPRWTSMASIEDNVSALLDWQEQVELKKYIDIKKMQLKNNDCQKIDGLLSSRSFIDFSKGNIKTILQDLEQEIPADAKKSLKKQIQEKWV